VMRYPSFISRRNTVQKVGGILNRHGHFKHTLRAQRCRDCGRWTLPCHTVPISHGSNAFSEKKNPLHFYWTCIFIFRTSLVWFYIQGLLFV
jgi:hypothetical protein